MKEYTVKAYSYNELSDEAKKRVFDLLDHYFGDLYDDECKKTLSVFEHIFDIKVWYYSVGTWGGYRYEFVKAGRALDCPENDPIRVARFIWNNYASWITSSKIYYSKKNMRKTRLSTAIKRLDEYILSGTCYDCYILEPVIKCLQYKEFFNSYDELIRACLDSFFSCWVGDIEYLESFEYFDEYMRDFDDNEYYENGMIFNYEVTA